jgi:regulator of protease activity HflC (stomatin/prohibitin superfamily)
MNEKVLDKKKNGMSVLLLTILLLALAVACVIYGGISMENGGSPVIFVVGMVVVCVGWIPLIGLKVLKPQEALVLTLFGKYYGTLKGEGFYFVNPFCGSVNPAAKTKLNQSGDVSGAHTASTLKLNANGLVDVNVVNNKISLKIMTLKMKQINNTLVKPNNENDENDDENGL